MVLIRRLVPEQVASVRFGRLDERGGDRHRTRPKWYTLCLDGEGKDLADGSHVYTLLAASDATGERTTFVEHAMLRSIDCFDWLLSLPHDARKVSFSFGYDVNMMLGDVPLVTANGRGGLIQLWNEGFTYWRGYRIAWTPRKVFTVARGTKRAVVWDMFGFFQESFSRTLHKWQVGSHEDRVLIADMKAKRAGFADEDNERIREYCLLECRLGAQVFDKLLEAVERAELKLQRYDGAGAVAAAMLRKNRVREYMTQTNPLPREVILAGYYGGRFDHTVYGEAGDCVEYDINSAYPRQCIDLPCLTHSRWREVTDYDPTEVGIYYVEWCIEESDLWGPFPYRSKHRIEYPRNGAGWYYGREVGAALSLYPNGVRIVAGYVLDRNCDHSPFAFVDGYYQARRILKDPAHYDFAEKILKLGLNSLYGKTAQNRGKHVPAHQSFVWAGLITSNTRAMLLDAIRECPTSVVLTATDAVASRTELSLDIGEELGQWERKILAKLFVIQNGVYLAQGAKIATRGFEPADIDFDAIRRRARREPSFKYTVTERSFIGLGEALVTNPPLKEWRRWVERTSEVQYGRYRGKIARNGRLFPAWNARGLQPSDVFEPGVYRDDGSNEIVSVDSLDDLLRVVA